MGFTLTLLTEYDSGRFNLTISEDGVFTGGRLLIRADLDPYAAQSAVANATDHDYYQTSVGLLVHEIMHAMGFLAHPDMASATSYDRDLTGWAGLAGHVLYPLDREALLATFTRLGPGDHRPEDIAQDLGPWSDTSIHVRGVLGLPGREDMAFGAAHRNGFAQPWAYGPAPEKDLSDNAGLSRLRQLGRPSARPYPTGRYGGRRRRSLGPARQPDRHGRFHRTGTVVGRARRHRHRHDVGRWRPRLHDLRARQTSSCRPAATRAMSPGAFFGAAHEGMGGTLDRDDLAAGFGGTR